MKNLLKLEELSLVALSIFLFSRLELSWWLYPVLFFLPDVSIIGYLLGPGAGATIYNVVHHKAVSIAIYLIGSFTGNIILQIAGVILLGHSSLDRVFGYGLKRQDSFQNTHLGSIGASSD